eukprot:gene5020-3615_t
MKIQLQQIDDRKKNEPRLFSYGTRQGNTVGSLIKNPLSSTSKPADTYISLTLQCIYSITEHY